MRQLGRVETKWVNNKIDREGERESTILQTLEGPHSNKSFIFAKKTAIVAFVNRQAR